MRVAVIGMGIAGGAAAWTLSKRYSVTVYDRELRPGGHSHTVTINYDGTPIAVDVGFIVYNQLNYPQLTALFDCVAAANELDIPIVADGGVRTSGDLTKALAAGAETVMVGSLLAGTEESPGRTVLRNGVRYKVYRGMASEGAAESRRQRESSEDVLDELAAAVVPEGVEAVVPYRGSLAEVMYQHVGGLRSGMSYLNARCLAELRSNARFVRMTEAGRAESHPHDLTYVE